MEDKNNKNSQTLEELIKNSDSGDLKEQLAGVIKNISKSEESKMNSFLETLKGMVETQKSLSENMEKIVGKLEDIFNKPAENMEKIVGKLEDIFNKPEKEFPEPKEFPKEIAVSKPSWYKKPPEPEKETTAKEIADALRPLFDSLEEKIGNEHDMTRDAIYETEPQEKTPEGETKKSKLPMNLGSVRRHSRWQIASTLKGTVKSAGDGLTFYLPFAPTPNSETVRLNGGLPLSQGEDYTMTGNKIVFVLDQTNSKIEVRAQN